MVIASAVALIVFVGVLVVVLRTGDDSSSASAGPACTAKGGQLTVAAAPDIAPTLTRLAAAYQPAGSAGCTVRVVSATPAAVVDAAASGWQAPWTGPRADVWVPDSSLWTRLAGGRPAVAPLLPASSPSLAASPLVIALPKPMADVLGWPDTTLGWSDLLGLARTSGGWGAYKHADWGPVRIARRDVRRSTDELQGLLALAGAVSSPGKPAAVTTAGLQGVAARSTLLGLGTVPTRPATDTADLLRGLRAAGGGTAGLRYVSLLTASEQEVFAYNRSKPPIQLTAVYPTDGSPSDDHPYVVLKGSWVTDPARTTAASFLATVRAGAGQAQLAADGFRTDGGGSAVFTAANGLSAAAPAVTLAETKADAADLTIRTWEALRRPGYALFVLTTGTADGATNLSTSKAGLAATLPVLFDNVYFGLWTAPGSDGRDHRELVPPGGLGAELGSGTRRAAALAALDRVQGTRGGTRLYDVILAAYSQARQDYDPARNATVIVYTTGHDDGSSVQLFDLVTRLKALADPARPIRLTLIVDGKDPDLVSMKSIAAVTDGAVLTNLAPGQGPITVLNQYSRFIAPATAG